MSREEIIKQEAKRILHIALEADDNYEASYAIEERLNILINTFSLTREMGEEGRDDDDNNTSDGRDGFNIGVL